MTDTPTPTWHIHFLGQIIADSININLPQPQHHQQHQTNSHQTNKLS